MTVPPKSASASWLARARLMPGLAKSRQLPPGIGLSSSAKGGAYSRWATACMLPGIASTRPASVRVVALDESEERTGRCRCPTSCLRSDGTVGGNDAGCHGFWFHERSAI